MLSCLFIAALWSPAGKRACLMALLYVMISCVFVIFQSGVVLDCKDSGSIPFNAGRSVHLTTLFPGQT